jgi:hypothetical protein
LFLDEIEGAEALVSRGLDEPTGAFVEFGDHDRPTEDGCASASRVCAKDLKLKTSLNPAIVGNALPDQKTTPNILLNQPALVGGPRTKGPLQSFPIGRDAETAGGAAYNRLVNDREVERQTNIVVRRCANLDEGRHAKTGGLGRAAYDGFVIHTANYFRACKRIIGVPAEDGLEGSQSEHLVQRRKEETDPAAPADCPHRRHEGGRLAVKIRHQMEGADKAGEAPGDITPGSSQVHANAATTEITGDKQRISRVAVMDKHCRMGRARSDASRVGGGKFCGVLGAPIERRVA